MGESSSRTTAPRFARLANLTGVGGVLAIVLGMVVAAVAYEGTIGQPYRVANHFVSELGEIGISRLAWAFNGGLIVGGIGILVFFIGIANRLNGWFRWIAVPGLLAAGALFAFLFLGGLVENLVNTTGPPPGFGTNRPDLWVSALFEWVAIGAILIWVAVVALIVAVRDRLPEK